MNPYIFSLTPIQADNQHFPFLLGAVTTGLLEVYQTLFEQALIISISAVGEKAVWPHETFCVPHLFELPTALLEYLNLLQGGCSPQPPALRFATPI